MKRSYYTGRDSHKALSIEELRQMSLRRLPSFAAEFLESGGEDEKSLRWNREAFDRHRFVPRTLVDTSARHTRIRLLGEEAPSPLIVAPTGHNGIFWRDGDLALARAAASHGIPFTLSTLSNARVARVREASTSRLWMQLYVFKDKRLTFDIVRQAERARCEALVLTTDANVFGWREWDRRQFRAPGRLTTRALLDIALHPLWALKVLVPHGPPRLENVMEFFPPDAQDTRAAVTHVPTLFAPTVTWDSVRELRRLWGGKLIVKGLLDVDDARRARDCGCDGIVLSNHGARHLDAVVSPLEVLPEVSAAVGAELTVIVDSGFRRGGDVVKALALGAAAVMVGRAPLYGLAADGERGAARALALLHSEIDRVMGQIGCNELSELTPAWLSGSPLPAHEVRVFPDADVRCPDTQQ